MNNQTAECASASERKKKLERKSFVRKIEMQHGLAGDLPVITIITRPIGNTMPQSSACRPGIEAASASEPPPTLSNRRPATDNWHPPITCNENAQIQVRTEERKIDSLVLSPRFTPVAASLFKVWLGVRFSASVTTKEVCARISFLQ